MATKAELEAELEQLQERNAALEAQIRPANDQARDHPGNNGGAGSAESDLHALLRDHGIDLTQVEALGGDLAHELARLQKEYPLSVLLVALTAGYLVGRTHK